MKNDYNKLHWVIKRLKAISKIYDKKQFWLDCEEYTNKNIYPSFTIQREDIYPITDEKNKDAGFLDKHYFLQDIYIAKEIFKEKPRMHYDIGSRVDGFIAHLLSFEQPVTLLDIRPLSICLENLYFIQTDATALEEIENDSIDSLSALHSIEHFGLGRYGDTINPSACFDTINKMKEKMKKDGRIYFSVPIGKEEKVCFNAHRIFSPKTIVETFNPMRLIKFIYIQNMKLITVDNFNEFNEAQCLSDYDCGLFIFEK